jgi:hypothetical protein
MLPTRPTASTTATATSPTAGSGAAQAKALPVLAITTPRLWLRRQTTWAAAYLLAAAHLAAAAAMLPAGMDDRGDPIRSLLHHVTADP